MGNVIERKRAHEQRVTKCAHPLALDKFDGRFGLHLRRLSCLVCRQEWWDSDGDTIGSTGALTSCGQVERRPPAYGVGCSRAGVAEVGGGKPGPHTVTGGA